MNTEFTVKLTPKNDKPVYSQSLPMPIHVKEDVPCGISLNAQIWDHHSTALFQVRKSHIRTEQTKRKTWPTGIDLRKINSLISDDYINNNHPVSTLSDAAQHLLASHYFVNWIALRRIIVHKWQTKDQ